VSGVDFKQLMVAEQLVKVFFSLPHREEVLQPPNGAHYLPLHRKAAGGWHAGTGSRGAPPRLSRRHFTRAAAAHHH
jgi:hypothetical protein